MAYNLFVSLVIKFWWFPYNKVFLPRSKGNLSLGTKYYFHFVWYKKICFVNFRIPTGPDPSIRFVKQTKVTCHSLEIIFHYLFKITVFKNQCTQENGYISINQSKITVPFVCSETGILRRDVEANYIFFAQTTP